MSSKFAPPAATRRGRLAGPPPPTSWLVSNEDEYQVDVHSDSTQRWPRSATHLMGTSKPSKLSLRYQVMKVVAKNFDWHLEYDHVYLSTLPVPVKSELMSLVAEFGPQRGCSLRGLKCLFASEDETGFEATTENEELTRLDLTGSIGRGLSLRELGKFWKRNKNKGRDQSPRVESKHELLESWELDTSIDSLRLDSPFRFPRLTRLSLAHPSPLVSWTDLLSFSKHLGCLTHLCLAHWPRPRLPQPAADSLNVEQAHTERPMRSLLPLDDRDDQESAHILQVLSRNTPSLEWLSIAGCHSWMTALYPHYSKYSTVSRPGLRRRNRHTDFEDAELRETRANPGPEWTNAWRHLRYVDVSQEWLPSRLPVRVLRAAKRLRSQHDESPGQDFNPRDMRSVFPFLHRGTEPETYRVIVAPNTPNIDIKRELQSKHDNRVWGIAEYSAIRFAARVKAVRKLERLERCEFDFGWGRDEALAAGYDEDELNAMDIT